MDLLIEPHRTFVRAELTSYVTGYLQYVTNELITSNYRRHTNDTKTHEDHRFSHSLSLSPLSFRPSRPQIHGFDTWHERLPEYIDAFKASVSAFERVLDVGMPIFEASYVASETFG